MKKGSAGNQKKSNSRSVKPRLSAATKRIKNLLAKAEKFILPKKSSNKTANNPAKNKKSRPSRPKTQKSKAPLKQTVPKTSLSREKSSLPSREDLPFSYNQTKLELLVRDQEWAFAWWDFSGETWRWIANLLQEDPATRAKLRVHNLGLRTFYDLDVHLDGKKWYVNLGFPDTEFEAELGLMDSKGRFHRIAQSNRIRTPRHGISKVIDPQWDPSEFSDLAQLSAKGALHFSGASMFSSTRVRKP